MAKTTSDIGIRKIAVREGTVLKGYLDSKGLLTVGVGHLVKPGEPYRLGAKITQAESDRLLKEDLAEAEHAVNSNVKVPLSQNQFDALVSFVVNIGTGGFKKSSVLRLLNQKDYNGAARAFMQWVKPPEIAGRRNTERIQFLTPYPKTSAPLAPVAEPATITSSVNADSTPQANADSQPDTLQTAGGADISVKVSDNQISVEKTNGDTQGAGANVEDTHVEAQKKTGFLAWIGGGILMIFTGQVAVPAFITDGFSWDAVLKFAGLLFSALNEWKYLIGGMLMLWFVVTKLESLYMRKQVIDKNTSSETGNVILIEPPKTTWWKFWQ